MFTGLVAVTGTVASVQPKAGGVGARIAFALAPGGRVNLEVDLIARYVARLLSGHE